MMPNTKYKPTGNPIGRPRTYTDPAKMQIKIDEYFQLCEEQDKFPGIAALALHLGFESKQSLYDYRDRYPEFSYPIKRALTLIEAHYENRLNFNNPTGAIFALKNIGWKDKQEIEQSVSYYEQLSDEGLDKQLSQLVEQLNIKG